eukprot:CAMPEP_0114252406 /NCGR_PEP_ID=MMETSP0058-20121206/15820_1 /TAXON_ID=36894 /ORGANISM="Pyramimonas parkeae, CCMP726" /LENGTH=71 /DNA_ID=CAMNT_0001366339 /DNA_START=124 /DNA_END=339 /DNA_ORIENTATION=+
MSKRSFASKLNEWVGFDSPSKLASWAVAFPAAYFIFYYPEIQKKNDLEAMQKVKEMEYYKLQNGGKEKPSS